MAALLTRRRNNKDSQNGSGLHANNGKTYGQNGGIKSSSHRQLGQYAFVFVVVFFVSFLYIDKKHDNQKDIVSNTATGILPDDATSAIRRAARSTTVEDSRGNKIKKEFSRDSDHRRVSEAVSARELFNSSLTSAIRRWRDSQTPPSSTTVGDKHDNNIRKEFSRGGDLQGAVSETDSGIQSAGATSRTRRKRDGQAARKNSVVKCDLDHFEYNDIINVAGSGSIAPVLVRGWNTTTPWPQDKFVQKFGNYQQYLKDEKVQLIKDNNGKPCSLPGKEIVGLMKTSKKPSHLFFTNNIENQNYMAELRKDYDVPDYLTHVNGFEVFSALVDGQSHSFHKHGESWIGQVEGSKMWWFLPPNVEKPERLNACQYLKRGGPKPPEGTLSCVQGPGDIIWFPEDWYHATCALDSWTVGVGAQQGPPIRQHFLSLDHSRRMNDAEIVSTKERCLADVPSLPLAAIEDNDDNNIKKEFSNWTWFNGDLNAYYNDLLKQDHKRDTNKIGTYAVHRWMGEKRSKEVHYELLHDGISRHYQANSRSTSLRVLDAGCGLGSGLMWMEQKEPDWKLVGHTISQEQRKFIIEELPGHKFDVNLRSYDDLDQVAQFDFVYSIEALIHSPDIEKTMKVWSDHLAEGGVIAIIDDFVQVGIDKTDEEMVNFAKSWLANSLVTPLEFGQICRKYGLSVVEDRDLGTEYRINELNYRNQVPEIKIDKNKDHQGWMGSKYRQRLMLLGKLTYHLVILKKNGPSHKVHGESAKLSESVPAKERSYPKKTSANKNRKVSTSTTIFNNPVIVECVLTSTNNNSSFSVNNKKLHITLRSDISPKASAAFLELVNAKYYDGVFIHRVLKGFIAQWGFRPKWDKNILAPKKRKEIRDRILPEGKSLSNTRGTLAFAGGSTVQVFINLGDNNRFDKEGGRPFATLDEESMDVADMLYTGNKDGDGQIATIKEGDNAVAMQFPNMSRIKTCRVLSSTTTSRKYSSTEILDHTLQKTWTDIDYAVANYPGAKVSGGLFLYPLQQSLLKSIIQDLSKQIMQEMNRPLQLCETGFGAGHSAAFFLSASTDVKVVSFDKFDREYQLDVAKMLEESYPNRLEHIAGNSCDTVPRHLSHISQDNSTYVCDILHGSSLCPTDNIDLIRNSPPGAVLTSTAMHSVKDREVYFGPKAQWRQLREQGCIKNIKCFAEDSRTLDRDLVFQAKGKTINHQFCFAVSTGKCRAGNESGQKQSLLSQLTDSLLFNFSPSNQIDVPT